MYLQWSKSHSPQDPAASIATTFFFSTFVITGSFSFETNFCKFPKLLISCTEHFDFFSIRNSGSKIIRPMHNYFWQKCKKSKQPYGVGAFISHEISATSGRGGHRSYLIHRLKFFLSWFSGSSIVIGSEEGRVGSISLTISRFLALRKKRRPPKVRIHIFQWHLPRTRADIGFNSVRKGCISWHVAVP